MVRRRLLSTGAKSFGSFHTKDVEVLIREQPSVYTPPALPFAWEESTTQLVEFGHDTSKELFALDRSWTFLNHGAFGAALRPSLNLANKWRQFSEEQPLLYFDRTLFTHLVYSHRRLATFINASPVDVVLVQNATTGLNCVMNSLPLAPGDRVAMFDVGYGSVKSMAQHICEERGAMLDIIPIGFPANGEQFREKLKQSFQQKTRYAIVDHVTSNTGLVLPIESLASLCQQYNVQMIVDGAHGMLSQDLDVQRFRHIAFYVSNCHKWLSSTSGLGFIWKNPSLAYPISANVISHGHGHGMLSEFM